MASLSDTMTRSALLPSPSETAPHLFLVLECDRPLALPARYGLRGLAEVTIGRGPERSAVIQGARLELRVADGRISSSHARLGREGEAWVIDDQGSKNGTLVNGRPVGRARLADGDLIELGDTFLLYRSALPVPAGSPAILDGSELHSPTEGLATMGLALGVDLARLRVIAASKVPVLIGGETGTGKELAARAIHLLSGRGGLFQALNCAALAPGLVESELLGHRRSTPSGAEEERPGLVAGADGGTLFLDEVGDLPPVAQGALLRVLQESEVLPVGATRPVKVDLRLVCATHQDLRGLVTQGRFRADLFARLSGFTITLPPLHQRREDLGLIIAALLPKLAPGRAASVTFTYQAARALLRYAWPHNVRELERCLAAAIVLAADGVVRLEHLPEAVREQRPGSPSPAATTRAAEQGVIPELKRRRVLRTVIGYGVAAFAVLQVIEPVMHGLHWPDPVLTYVVVALSLGFPVVVVLAWIFDVNAGRIERTPPSRLAGLRGWRLALPLIGLSAVAAMPGLGWYLLVRVPSTPALRPAPVTVAAEAAGPSVAVLPFADLGTGPEPDRLSGRITAGLLDALAGVEGARVVAGTAAPDPKGGVGEGLAMAGKLGATTVLIGDVRRAGPRVRVATRLLRVADGAELWSQGYDGEAAELADLQARLASAVAAALEAQRPAKEAPPPVPPRPPPGPAGR